MPTARTLAALAIATLTAGCAGRPVPPTRLDPRPYADRAWRSERARDHRLAGYVLSVRDERWIDAAELERALAQAELVFLGEIHDNADHHLLQAEYLRAVLAAGRRPALAFEMIDTSQAEALAKALAAPGATPEVVEEATGWKKSGWPDFPLYRPIFEAGLGAGLPIVAANLPRGPAREAVRKGKDALPPDVRAAIEKAGPPSPAEVREWAREMAEDHCGEVPEELLPGMVLAQRARDAQMALRLVEADADGRGAVLVTGGGHARTDRGVPAWLLRERPGLRVVSVGLVEVDEELRWPRRYAESYGTARLPFDYVVFTPRAEREDPCESLRKRNHAPPSAGK